MKFPWRKRERRIPRAYGTVEFEPLEPIAPEAARAVDTAVDTALFEHATRERVSIDKMFLRMLQQVGPERHGLLVESEFKPTPFDIDHGDNVTSAMIETTITLSPEVPFGEVRYRDKKAG